MSPIIEAMKPSPNSDRQSCASSGELFPKNGTAFATESPTTFVSSRPTFLGWSRSPGIAIRMATFLPGVVLGKDPPAAGKGVGFEEEAENNGAVGRHRLVPVAGRPPDELTGSARALVILEAALEHERLLQRGVLVQRHDRARIELEQGRGDAAVVA